MSNIAILYLHVCAGADITAAVAMEGLPVFLKEECSCLFRKCMVFQQIQLFWGMFYLYQSTSTTMASLVYTVGYRLTVYYVYLFFDTAHCAKTSFALALFSFSLHFLSWSSFYVNLVIYFCAFPPRAQMLWRITWKTEDDLTMTITNIAIIL